jgi:hypothetical protein
VPRYSLTEGHQLASRKWHSLIFEGMGRGGLLERWCGWLGVRGLGRGCGHSSAPYRPVAQPFGRPLQELLVHGDQTFELVAVPFCMLEDLIKFG